MFQTTKDGNSFFEREFERERNAQKFVEKVEKIFYSSGFQFPEDYRKKNPNYEKSDLKGNFVCWLHLTNGLNEKHEYVDRIIISPYGDERRGVGVSSDLSEKEIQEIFLNFKRKVFTKKGRQTPFKK